jgi:hypothetical protein
MPPSINELGQRYQWAGARHMQLEPLPLWFTQLIDRRPGLPVERAEVPVDPCRATAYGSAALRRELHRLQHAVEGTRIDQISRSAFALGQLVAAGTLDELETTILLVATGQSIVLSPQEVERTVASGLTAGMEQRRSLIF